MGDAMDEEKERRQQLAGVSAAGCHGCCAAWGGPPPPLPHPAKAPTPRQLLPPAQVRKEAREAIARERDQQIAMMIARCMGGRAAVGRP